jgi:outer membrane receptor protein involved in Fe transport
VDWVQGYDPGIAVTTNPFIGYDASGQPLYGDAYSYLGDADKHRRLTLTQKVFEVAASGKLLNGWAGAISAALGLHWRKEGIDQKVQASQGNSAADPTYYPVWCPDNVVTTNSRCIAQVSRGIRPPGNIGVRGVPANPYQNSVETQFSNVPFVSGSFDVKEAFTEVLVPLLTSQPWMQNLSFQGAARWADYAGSGSIWSYKAGLDAAFNDQIRLRGTFSHDTRAANIAERFDRTGGLTLPLTDRISPLPAGWTNPTAVTTVNGGNPEVKPEEADTFTAGFVYRPQWLPGFDLSVDWLRVSLKGAIEQLPAQRVIDLCYLEGDQDQCARITRDPATNTILFIPQTAQNLSKSRIEAVDLEFGYAHGVRVFGGNERLALRVFGSYLIENSTTSSQGVKTDSTGSVPLQLFKRKVNASLNYGNGPFSWNLQARYNGGGELSTLFNQVRTLSDGQRVTIWDVADNTMGASVYWDTRVGYDIPLGGGNVELFANVTNLFDRAPPRLLAENLATQTGGGFDELGRRYVVGFNLKF